jgi:DNA-binding transcriptional MerR regulator
MTPEVLSSATKPMPSTLSGLHQAEVKAPSAFRTISEVATSLDVPQHVLRFWESKFQQIRPMKRGGGRRYYRPEDVSLLGNIKELLYTEGMTIKGVQKLLREGARPQFARAPARAEAPAKAEMSLSPVVRHEIEEVLGELKSLRDFMRKSGV